MFNFSGKTVLITGASGGIGSVVAKEFVNHGAQVFITGMEESKLEALKNELGEGCAGFCKANLCDDSELKNLHDSAVKAMGKIDILINSAGITRDSLFMRVKDADWNLHMDINLNSVWKLTKMTIMGMMKNRYGRVINLSSIVGCMGNAGQVAYSTSKAALLGMTKTLAREVVSRGITVNAIAPGFIETPMTKDLLEKNPEIFDNIPAKKAGTPKNVAAGALYLASEEADYVTGETLHINGGMLMC
ncbi:SDR family oxidoreductase [Candidatus Cytomitobacter indipagum]|uniref:SDR family oxidoreductase n=1 Tax=Candidatus Cytomitobacter indipagum TaxID=2601575 RepID=A0A5C0UGA5_9PROT|nr:SDR family NAD(P)-dependent oxidoreductase [Candidatus Cytomitobacter indipagum]QEK38074.1 SDR family oxidoreductase [Candidatus Cytomitobacter indipagum]